METTKALILGAPGQHLDASMKLLIEKWNDEPTSIQILEVLDHCIFNSLGSDFIVWILHHLYDKALKAEGIFHEDNVPKAVWRT